MEEWRNIKNFDGYSVSNHGNIRNDKTERILKVSENQSGLVMVGMMRYGIQRHRHVALLVAEAFLEKPPGDSSTSPINRDGDRYNNHVDNLLWRPRWFAVQYNQQFRERYSNGIDRKIVDTKTGEVYESTWDCAIRNGLLEKDVVMSILNRTFTWPTYQFFAILAD